MQSRTRHTLALGLALLLAPALAALPGAARAADPDAKNYEIGLYIWGSSVAGDVDTDKGSASMHISFSDLIDHINVAGMLRARAQFDEFSLVFDGEYFDLESDRETRTVRLGPRGNIEFPASAKVELDMWILELNGGYRLFDIQGPFAQSATRELHTRGELYAGGRYYSVKPTLDLDLGSVHEEFGDWTSWLDGVVGLRFGIDLSRTVVLGIQGDVGGFNLGNSSKFSWSQITSLSWAFSDSMTLYLGYKFLDFKRDFGDSELDIQLRGPFIASAIRF